MWVSILILLLQIPAIPSPTPLPTITPYPTMESNIPENEVYYFLSTAVANVNALPDDLSAPGGVPLLPATNGSQLFGYAKWMFSGTSAQELLGSTVSPVGISIYVAITLVVVLASVYLIVNLVTLLIKVVTWIIQQALRLIPFIGVMLLQVPPTPTPMPPPGAAPFNIPSDYRMWSFADNAVGWWNQFGNDKTQVIQIAIIVVIVFVSMLSIKALVKSLSRQEDP